MNTFNSVQKAMARSPSLPNGLQLDDLESKKRQMNKIMMKYVE
jgi:hypothetical protein